MSPLLETLNPEQRAAVTLAPQHALILAGAGSGKTRVLITRIAWLLSNHLALPHQILAVTFTNKAAKEMLTRLSSLLPINTRGMWIGTFHGLCNRMLRTHHREAGLPQLFQILDHSDQLSAIKRLLKTLGVDDKKVPPRELQQFINGHKEAGRRAQHVAGDDPYSATRCSLYQEYEAQCHREGVVDFAELLLRCFELLEHNPALQQHYQQRFRHILVDEFQDTNPLQYRWLKLLAGHGQSDPAALFCVGDDDQSIYGFRGADVGNMLDFEREFGVAKLIRLEQNYRSQGTILDAANAIIQYNPQRLGKNLWTDQGAGEPIRVFEADTDNDEARYIVSEIQSLLEHSQIPRHQIALLYRSNAQSRVLEHQLFTAGVPYRVYGGLRFFDRQEIKHALAYLRLLANPDDDTAFSRVVNFPTRGIGARSLEQLQDAAKIWQTSLYAAVPHLSGKAGSSLAQFVRLIETLSQKTQHLPLPEQIRQVLETSGLLQHYQQDKEGQERLENLDQLINAATLFLAEENQDPLNPGLANPLADFLAHASLEAGEHQADAGQEAVQLMTVHAAKGLEFEAVFLSGLEEGLFPHDNSLTDEGSVAEERRLMYVAVTRARRRLYLTRAHSRLLHGQKYFHPRSRFLEEIPPPLLKWLTPPNPAKQSGLNDYFSRPSATTPKTYYKAPAPISSAKTVEGFSVGQSVSHPRFGSGVITAVGGQGSEAQVEVNFSQHGRKWLMLALAKLTVL